MCQLQHPNIVGAEDIYLPSDIPLEHRIGSLRLQRSNTDHIFVRMPYCTKTPFLRCNSVTFITGTTLPIWRGSSIAARKF